MPVVACIAPEAPPAALRVLIDAAGDGVAAQGATFLSWDESDPLDADGFLFAAPVVLFGLPGGLKARLDAWLDLLPQGRLVPRTTDKPAGFLAVYEPDDDAIGEVFEAQMRGILGYLGMVYRGCALGFAAPRAKAPADDRLVRVARNLGEAVAGNRGFAGWPREYRAGIDLFNRGEFWEAHEVWEDLWIREETEVKLFYQGLIQIAGAFHHHGNGNWAGMRSLLEDGVAKVERYRPFTQGLDVDAFLRALSPWRDLAGARTGKAPVVTRVPGEPPRLSLQG